MKKVRRCIYGVLVGMVMPSKNIRTNKYKK